MNKKNLKNKKWAKVAHIIRNNGVFTGKSEVINKILRKVRKEITF